MLVEELRGAIRTRRPRQRRDCIDDQAKFFSPNPNLLFQRIVQFTQSCFGLFAHRDVLETHQNPALRATGERQGMGIKNKRSFTLYRKDMIHLNGLERTTVGKHLCELHTQLPKFKSALPEFVEWYPLRLVARDPELCVKGPISRLNPLVCAQHDERFGDRVEDRLGGFAFVDSLIDAWAESGHICECQQDASDLAIDYRIGRYPNNEPLVSVAKIGSNLQSTGDDLVALLFQAGQAGEHRDIAGCPSNVRLREAKRLRPRLIEIGDSKVASKSDNRNFNGIKDVNEVGRIHTCGRGVTVDPSETVPAAI